MYGMLSPEVQAMLMQQLQQPQPQQPLFQNPSPWLMAGGPSPQTQRVMRTNPDLDQGLNPVQAPPEPTKTQGTKTYNPRAVMPEQYEQMKQQQNDDAYKNWLNNRQKNSGKYR